MLANLLKDQRVFKTLSLDGFVMLTMDSAIFTSFLSLPDPRRPAANLKHDLYEMTVLALCAFICNANTWADVERFGLKRIEWLRRFLKLENGIPSHDTLGRTFAALNTHAFAACIADWIDRLNLELKGKGIHIDGKVARHSFNTASGQSGLHLVSAWCNELSVCLGQVSTDEKSNEITAVPMLLDLLEIRGAVVTLDAMNCQRKTVAKIRDKQADYVITVKANQGTLHKEIEQRFIELGDANYPRNKCSQHKTASATRGRIEERTVIVAAAPTPLKDDGKWADIKTIGMVYRHREPDPKSPNCKPVEETDHVTYFISSLPPKAEPISSYVREHWSVENSLHWSLDVTFGEDNSRIRMGNGQEIIGAFRRLALSILRMDTSLAKQSIRGKRFIASLDPNALEAIITSN